MSKFESNWQNTWRPILERPDGSIDVDQLKKELADFSELIDRMGTLTCEITRHRLSYPTYPVKTILSVMRECEEEEREEQRQEDREHGTCSFCERDFE